ncbi:hypothetical protein QBC40DRAFT_264721 [Triangularia verruculosa]|uniref:Ankyrin repeat protein n=1 Tax=Triangularia verruculosa TaxID=2587418 RepID=A0AAN7AXE5_9PEZI|nr:hypothetical protein QBC40DRAFT_264721 [Triangularia verruculosa]
MEEPRKLSPAASIPLDIALEIADHFTTAQQYNTFAMLSHGFYHLFNRRLYRFNMTKQATSAAGWACSNGNIRTLERLKEHGAAFPHHLIHRALDAPDEYHIPVMSFLLANGVDIDCEVYHQEKRYFDYDFSDHDLRSDPWGHSCGNPECREMLRLFRLPGYAWTPLSLAIRRGHTKSAIWLIKQGVSIHNWVPRALTVLRLAVYEGNQAMVRYIIQHGLEEVRGSDGTPILHYALHCKIERRGMIELLLELGADNKSEIDRRSPLTYAVNHGKFTEASQLFATHTRLEIKPGDDDSYSIGGKTDFLRGIIKATLYWGDLRARDVLRCPSVWLSEKHAVFVQCVGLLSLEPGWGDALLRAAITHWAWIPTATMAMILDNLPPKTKPWSDIGGIRDFYLPGLQMEVAIMVFRDCHATMAFVPEIVEEIMNGRRIRTRRTKATASTCATTTSTVIESNLPVGTALDITDVEGIGLSDDLNQRYGDMMKLLLDHGDGLKLDLILSTKEGFWLTVLDYSTHDRLGGFIIDTLLEEATEKNWSGRKEEAMSETLLELLLRSVARYNTSGAKVGPIRHDLYKGETAKVLMKRGAVIDDWENCGEYEDEIRGLYESLKKEVKAGDV